MSVHKHHVRQDEMVLDPSFDGGAGTIPKHRLPQGTQDARAALRFVQDARAALRFVQDELMLDGNARQNLATFVTTWIEPEAAALIQASLEKNIIDKDE